MRLTGALTTVLGHGDLRDMGYSPTFEHPTTSAVWPAAFVLLRIRASTQRKQIKLGGWSQQAVAGPTLDGSKSKRPNVVCTPNSR